MNDCPFAVTRLKQNVCSAAAGQKHQAGLLHLTGRSLSTLPDLQKAKELYAAANRQVDVA